MDGTRRRGLFRCGWCQSLGRIVDGRHLGRTSWHLFIAVRGLFGLGSRPLCQSWTRLCLGLCHASRDLASTRRLTGIGPIHSLGTATSRHVGLCQWFGHSCHDAAGSIGTLSIIGKEWQRIFVAAPHGPVCQYVWGHGLGHGTAVSTLAQGPQRALGSGLCSRISHHKGGPSQNKNHPDNKNSNSSNTNNINQWTVCWNGNS